MELAPPSCRAVVAGSGLSTSPDFQSETFSNNEFDTWTEEHVPNVTFSLHAGGRTG